jgi:hypothetical protein
MSAESLATPSEKINNAAATLILSARFHSACINRRITSETFLGPTQIDTGGLGITIPSQVYSHEKLVDQSFNIFLLAVGSSAIVLDEALDQAFGKKNPSDTSNRGNLRAIIYMIRCAFAHCPFAPIWKIKDRYLRKLSVTHEDFVVTLDCPTLNGAGVKPEHFGGFESYIKLYQYAARDVAIMSV